MPRPQDWIGRHAQPRRATRAGQRAGGVFATVPTSTVTTGVAHFDTGRFDEGLFGDGESFVATVNRRAAFDFGTFDYSTFAD